MKENSVPNGSVLTERLLRLSDDAPPTAIDVERAMSEGLRVRRRRVRTGFGLSAFLVLACAAGLVVGAGHADGSGTRRTPLVSTPEVTFPADDPFQVGAQFGWLPSDIKARDQYSLGLWSRDLAAWQTASTDDGSQWISLRTAPANLSVQQAVALMADVGSDPAPDVTSLAQINGRPAYSVVTRDPHATLKNGNVLWRLPDGRWGLLMSYQMPASDSLPTLWHVAETVTEGSTPQAMPLRITGLPKGASIDAGQLWQPVGERDEWYADLDISYRDEFFRVMVTAPGFAGPAGSEPSGAVCETRNGLKACVSPEGEAFPVPAQLSDNGLEGLFRYVTLMGADRKSWTVHVIDGQ